MSDFYDFSDLKSGMRVQVEGSWEQGTLHAHTIAIKDDSQSDEIEAAIDRIDLETRSLRMLGLTIPIDAATEIKDIDKRPLPLESLRPGMRLKAKGTVDGDRFVPEKLKLKMAAPDDMDEIEGTITALDPAARTLAVFGLPIRCDADVEIEA